jgi:hypothetical protein
MQQFLNTKYCSMTGNGNYVNLLKFVKSHQVILNLAGLIYLKSQCTVQI